MSVWRQTCHDVTDKNYLSVWRQTCHDVTDKNICQWDVKHVMMLQIERYLSVWRQTCHDVTDKNYVSVTSNMSWCYR